MLISLKISCCQSEMLDKKNCMKVILRYMCDLLGVKMTSQGVEQDEFMFKTFGFFEYYYNYLEIISTLDDKSVLFHCVLDNILQKDRIEYMSNELIRLVDGELSYFYVHD